MSEVRPQVRAVDEDGDPIDPNVLMDTIGNLDESELPRDTEIMVSLGLLRDLRTFIEAVENERLGTR